MAFTEVVGLDCDSTTALGGVNKKTGKPNPKKAEGYYLGSKEVDSKMSKTGKAFIHILQTPNGTLGIWGKSDLDRKIKSVTPGTMVRVTQNGTAPTNKGNPMFKFKVEVDSDNTIDVGPAQESSVDAGSYGEDTADTSYAEDPTYAEAAVDAEEQLPDEIPLARASAPKRPAAAPSAERQAAVQKLLNRGRSA